MFNDFDQEYKNPRNASEKYNKDSLFLWIHLNDSLKWNSHIDYIYSKASSRIWILLRMMELGIDYEVILDIYFKEIRSILEYGSVIFHSGLSRKLSRNIEAVQKRVLNHICKYLNLELTYDESCVVFLAENLEARRVTACERFIKVQDQR